MVGTIKWINVDKTTGTGSSNPTIVNITVDPTTGRNSRSGTINVTGNTDIDTFTRTVTITQNGLGLSLSVDNSEIDISNSTTQVEITGISNSKNLGISCIDGLDETPNNIRFFVDDLDITDAHKNVGYIPGDPGSTAQYRFKYVIPIPSNPNTTQRRLIVFQIDAADGDNTIQKTINVNQGTNYVLSIYPTSLTFGASGGTQSISINSNTTWEIS